MKIGVPSGIGDFSWMWSKLCHVRDEIDEIVIADGWPYRTAEYVQLLGVRASYGPFTYPQILMNEQLNGFETWKQIRESGHSMVLLEANKHLEHGKRLEEWLPDLPVNFHYSLDSRREFFKAKELFHGIKEPLVGVSCASYRGSEAWKTWGRSEWTEFLGRVIDLGWKPILLGGFWDDLTYSVAQSLGIPDLVGKTSIEEAVAIQDMLDAYIGFSSGLGVIRTVLDKPCMMMWPDHQVELSRSWAPLDMLMSNRYVASLWRPVNDVWPVAKTFLEMCYGEKQENEKPGREYRSESEARKSNAEVPA